MCIYLEGKYTLKVNVNVLGFTQSVRISVRFRIYLQLLLPNECYIIVDFVMQIVCYRFLHTGALKMNFYLNFNYGIDSHK